MKYFKISEFAEKIGKTTQTLRNWDKSGILKPAYTTNGIRYYSQAQMFAFIDNKRKTIGYYLQNDNEKTIEDIKNIKTYMYSKGYNFEIIIDKEPIFSFENEKVKKIINMVSSLEVERIVIKNKNIMTNDIFNLLIQLCDIYGVTIEIIENTTNKDETKLQLIKILENYKNELSEEDKNIINITIKNLKDVM